MYVRSCFGDNSHLLTKLPTWDSSCILCRRRKIRCNRETPCSNCAKSKNATCVYRDAIPQPELQGPFGDPTSPDVAALTPSTSTSSNVPIHSRSTATASSTAVSTVDGQSPASHVKHPESQTTQVEQQGFTIPCLALAGIAPISTFTRNSRVETTTVDFAGKFHFHREQRLPGQQPQAVTRSVTHKTRLFGQSHWVNAVALVSLSVVHVLVTEF
jgi:hypothetical protein